MAKSIFLTTCVILLVGLSHAKANEYDDIDIGIDSGNLLKMLRDMVNQTDADTLNLPANATSIRENIVDTFSCENRTYGYYADVDNDCQIFHVCLPSQTPSGRNITYRWSFICPNETVFNQEVLVCTRPRDAVDCEDAPMYYDVNMEFGKVSNDTQKAESDTNETGNQNEEKEMNAAEQNNMEMQNKNERKRIVQKIPSKTSNRKENIVVEKLKRNRGKLFEFREDAAPEDGATDFGFNNESGNDEIAMANENAMIDDRIESGRTARRGRKINRGTFRFKADV